MDDDNQASSLPMLEHQVLALLLHWQMDTGQPVSIVQQAASVLPGQPAQFISMSALGSDRLLPVLPGHLGQPMVPVLPGQPGQQHVLGEPMIPMQAPDGLGC